MFDHYMPQNKVNAVIYLKAKKQMLIELSAKILENDLSTLSEISGTISNELDELDERLEAYL